MSHDTLVHRLLRRPVGALARTRVTPDMLTGLRLITALLSAGCLVHAGRLIATGAGLSLLSALLDRADGELARQSRQFSRVGPRFDLLSDCTATMSLFVGLGIGVGVPYLLPPAGFVLGVSAAISVAAIFALLNAAHSPSEVGPSGSGRGRPFDPDDVLLVLPVLIWLGEGGWIVLAGGVLAPLIAILLAAVTSSHRIVAGRLRGSPR